MENPGNMAFWKKTDTKEKESGADAEGVSDVSAAVSSTVADTIPSPRMPGRDARIPGVLRDAHTTEKTAAAAFGDVYVFKVAPGANKITVKKAVEAAHQVSVVAVRMLNTAQKARVRGRIIGWKAGFKKAMVTIKKGEKIEIQ